MEGGSKKERIEAKFQGVCPAGRRILILLSQRMGRGGGGEQRDFTASQEEAPQGRRPLKAQQQEWKGSTGCLSQAGSELGARLARTLGVRGG